MYGRDDIRFVDTRHEEGAAFMAYGYARASGKPTACITTSGPGTTHRVTGIPLAAKGCAPVLAIAGDVARDYIYRDGSQAFDLVGLFKPITKLSLEVNLTARIPEMLHYAFRAMLSDKRGPATRVQLIQVLREPRPKPTWWSERTCARSRRTLPTITSRRPVFWRRSIGCNSRCARSAEVSGILIYCNSV